MVEIKGLQKTTLLDYPGKVACIAFLGACNFRCPFCQNSDLVLRPEKLSTTSEEDFFMFLKSRLGKLEGVVITGGEPTLQQDLPELIKRVKKLGYSVKLDTNGTNPEMVAELIKQHLIDYAAVDYKGPLGRYDKYIGQISNFQSPISNSIKKTIKILVNSGIDFELRTTVVPGLHDRADLIQMAQELRSLPLKWYLQNFSPKKCLDPEFEKTKPYPKSFYDEILPELKRYVPTIEVRGE